ncbi:MAG TPA: choice-of-anchor tandem repeat GloVer-containing protein [Rhizomicrobium sp.]|jgi:uncharacterized repeat protein (TIGR03803 family)|nr:choice-of-anchor tandem repeat GloVer-containing protein [Rhizomicrobium sp.]
MRSLGVTGKSFLVAGTMLAAVVLPATAHAFGVLHVFRGGSDGEYPSSGVIEDAAGNLYGMTGHGGGGCYGYGCGIVFRLAPDGKESVVYVFDGGSDGYIPSGGLIADAAGNLYGTTEYGGGQGCSGGYGCGTVFRLAPNGSEIVLYAFAGTKDGAQPVAGLIEDAAGNLFGTTLAGGGNGCQENGDGCGTVFEIAPDATETLLYKFTGGNDGGNPLGSLIADSSGNLYGTTYEGGSYGYGAVFKLAPGGAETVLHAFASGRDGANPGCGLIRDKAGNLYGTTFDGGPHNRGTVFRLAPDGTETVLYAFAARSDGYNPSGGVTRDKAGDLYGTTGLGGVNRRGTVFKLAPDGTETVLYAFGKGAGGGNYPGFGVIRDKHGYLYGTTANGGGNNDGAIFRLKD